MSDELTVRLASSNSERDTARHEAAEAIEWPLRELAANFMRVIRGAGKPHEIGRQCVRVVERFNSYRDAHGCYPSSFEIMEALRLNKDESYLERCSEESLTWYHAEKKMVRGALQVAASQLLGQLTQERAGDSEMFEGMRPIEEIRERNRRQYQGSTRKKR